MSPHFIIILFLTCVGNIKNSNIYKKRQHDKEPTSTYHQRYQLQLENMLKLTNLYSLYSININHRKKQSNSIEKKPNNSSSYLILLLISTANYIQLNPGPNSTSYNCGTCDLPVTWDDKVIMSDTCNQWYHTTCQSVHSKTYEELANNSAIAWDCIICNNPNYSSICFDQILTPQTSFPYYQNYHHSLAQKKTNDVRPIHASTPIRNSSTKGRVESPYKNCQHKLPVNKTKQYRINNLLDSVNT